jgi:hypothetical protein
MPRVKEVEEGDPSTNAGGSGEVPPLKGDGSGSKPSTPKGSKVDQLVSELKVLKLEQKITKLKKKLKSKVQEGSSSSLNEEVNDSSNDERSKDKRGKGEKKHGSKPSYNTTFNYDSLPSNHTFTSVHSEKAPHFDGTNYSKWRHGMKMHLMSLNPSIWKVVCMCGFPGRWRNS